MVALEYFLFLMQKVLANEGLFENYADPSNHSKIRSSQCPREGLPSLVGNIDPGENMNDRTESEASELLHAPELLQASDLEFSESKYRI